MIDLHCHILPGVDDGAETMTDSLSMAKAAVDNGISHILCTPHHNNGRFENESGKVIRAVSDLQQELDQSGIPLTVYEGQEIRIYGDILEDYKAGKLLTVDTTERYLLIEFPTADVPAYSERLFVELIGNGFTPIIVHPERNGYFREDPNRLIPFLDMGCLAQLTAPSYVGVFGKSIQKTAKQMVEHSLVQMVASDAHGVTKRPFKMKEAYEAIQKDFGGEKVKELQQVARDILNGDSVESKKHKKIKRGFFGLIK